MVVIDFYSGPQGIFRATFLCDAHSALNEVSDAPIDSNVRLELDKVTYDDLFLKAL